MDSYSRQQRKAVSLVEKKGSNEPGFESKLMLMDRSQTDEKELALRCFHFVNKSSNSTAFGLLDKAHLNIIHFHPNHVHFRTFGK